MLANYAERTEMSAVLHALPPVGHCCMQSPAHGAKIGFRQELVDRVLGLVGR